MVEICDLHAGVAFGLSGILALGAWVYHDGVETNRKGVGWRLLGTVLTLGAAAVLFAFRQARSSDGRKPSLAAILAGIWCVSILLGGVATAYVSSHNRGMSTQVFETSASSPGARPPAPSWGAFEKAFPARSVPPK